MQNKKNMSESIALDGYKLWDEILKAIVYTMPSQLFPLFKEVYGRNYPKDTPVVLLGTETSSFQENQQDPPGSTFMDIALLVSKTDYYHLECQMKNDKEMLIRVFAYDVRFAITHTKTRDKDTGEVTLYFPRSVIIYPEKNNSIPDHLQCRVVFQDNSEHTYRIPTVKIQTYSLEEIHKKHLTLFIPYTLLRLRPRLKAKTEHLLTQKELTEFVKEAILVLDEERSEGNLTDWEYRNYVTLFRFAADRVLARYPQMREEVNRMTEPLIKLPSMIWDEMQVEIAEKKSELAEKKAELDEKKAELDEKKAELDEKKAELDERNAEIADQKVKLASKDAEIQRLQELVAQLSSKSC